MADQPAWLTNEIGPVPEEDSSREQEYRDAARVVATYRDRYQVDDAVRPLGHEPSNGDGRQLRDWRQAQDRLAAARPDTEARPGLAERARQLRERTEQQRQRAQQPNGQQHEEQQRLHDQEQRQREQEQVGCDGPELE